jgi:hypothetical protein
MFRFKSSDLEEQVRLQFVYRECGGDRVYGVLYRIQGEECLVCILTF